MIFPANEIPIIFGRPFLATGKTLIDKHKGELTIRVNDQEVTFNMNKVKKAPNEPEECHFVQLIVEKVHECFQHVMVKDDFEVSLTMGEKSEDLEV